ncbi:MAG: extra-cytoplasmic solute receptor [Betaproteobacteria bacterium]|nr:extra-cytoplasmic solute receptor [Betaproteobacteria bacterium]
MKFNSSMYILAAALSTLWSCAATAQSYPLKPIRLIVPYPPGGGTDFVARLVALKLPDELGQNVVVDNRPGAAGLIGTELAARAPADGYTLLLVDSSLPINVTYYKNAKYDAIKDFDPISDVADTPYMLVVAPNGPYQTVRDLISAAKAQPGRINYGSGGNGSGGHLTGELFQIRAGVKLTHVPYKGLGFALTDVIAGQIQTTFTSAPPAMALIKSGRIKSIAVATEKRIASLPDVPTFGEQGVRNLVVVNWYGIASIGGTPKPVLDKLHAALLKVIALPEVKERFAQGALEPAPMSQAAFRKLIADELARWSSVIKTAGIKPD